MTVPFASDVVLRGSVLKRILAPVSIAVWPALDMPKIVRHSNASHSLVLIIVWPYVVALCEVFLTTSSRLERK
jgi:hypothetical protein